MYARLSVKDDLDSRTTISSLWDFPTGAVVKTPPPTAGEQIQSLVRELRSHMPQGAVKKQTNKTQLSFSDASFPKAIRIRVNTLSCHQAESFICLCYLHRLSCYLYEISSQDGPDNESCE